MSDDDFDPVKRTEEISMQLRQAIVKALPSPLEQFFTVMVPGKVVNLDDYSEGFDHNGKLIQAILPAVTELNQAILCDDMPTLSPVQLGPTGKSVARSYDAAISKLVPAGTTVGVDIADPENLNEAETRYLKAMMWLTYRDPTKGSHTRVELYTQKQRAYTEVVEAKTREFNEALKRAMEDPRNTTIEEKRAAYDAWVSENGRTYRNFMQAAYMDWVVTGNKEEVEYWFSIVDRDSAMARVEASKEAMRASVVQNSDGSVEFQKVILTPSSWAVIAKNKAYSGTDQTRTVEWYAYEISRLSKMNGMLKALQSKEKSEVDYDDDPDIEADQAALNAAMVEFVQKRDDHRRTLSGSGKSDEEKQDAYDEYVAARDALLKTEVKIDEDHILAVNYLRQTTQDKMYDTLKENATEMIKANDVKITEYTTKRDTLTTQQEADGGTLLTELYQDANIPAPLADPLQDTALVDYFTAITVEISASSFSDSSSSRVSASSFGASVGWGFWSAGANASYSSASSDAAMSMAKNSCKVSFECMRVDIMRPWLRSELFYDADLTTGPEEFISPGFKKLRDLMEGGVAGASPESIERELERYSTFPMYPTAFMLAANVVLEITGETTEIQSFFRGGGSFGYGPFRISASHASSSELSNTSCKATAEGCRITIKSPQIIGWVSQMVPALPRLRDQPLP